MDQRAAIRQIGFARQLPDEVIEGLGLDYLEQLDAKPTPAELATPWRRLVNPFRMRSLDVVAGTQVDAGTVLAVIEQEEGS